MDLRRTSLLVVAALAGCTHDWETLAVAIADASAEASATTDAGTDLGAADERAPATDATASSDVGAPEDRVAPDDLVVVDDVGQVEDRVTPDDAGFVDAPDDAGFVDAPDDADVAADVPGDVPVDQPTHPCVGAFGVVCDGACRDTRSDLAHCGGCGRACRAPINGTPACQRAPPAR